MYSKNAVCVLFACLFLFLLMFIDTFTQAVLRYLANLYNDTFWSIILTYQCALPNVQNSIDNTMKK